MANGPDVSSRQRNFYRAFPLLRIGLPFRGWNGRRVRKVWAFAISKGNRGLGDFRCYRACRWLPASTPEHAERWWTRGLDALGGRDTRKGAGLLRGHAPRCVLAPRQRVHSDRGIGLAGRLDNTELLLSAKAADQRPRPLEDRRLHRALVRKFFEHPLRGE